MERRVALKNMGLAFGYTVAAPTLLGIVQSCTNKKVLDWTPDFFTKDEGTVLHTLVDIILPKTDTPSATEVNVHLFIDKFAKEVLPKEQQDFLKTSMGHFTDKALSAADKEAVADLDEKDLEPVLATYLKKRTDEDEEAHQKAVNAYLESMEENGSGTLDTEIACYSFATSLRDFSIMSYRTSEYVGEQVLAYLPVPGEYIPCEDVDTLTGGKSWSL